MGSRMENNQNSSNQLYKKIALIVGIILVVCGGILYYFTNNVLYDDKIASNVSIEGIDVSKMTKDEAYSKVNEKYKPENLKLQYKDKDYEINAKDINLTYNTKQLVNEAYNSTRTNSLFKDIGTYLSIKFNGKNYTIKPTYNKKKINNSIKSIAKDVNVSPKNAKISIGSSISYTPSKTGLKLDQTKYQNLVKDALDKKNYSTIDIELVKSQPKYTTSDVKAINTCLGSYSTSAYSSAQRAYNIALAASRCNGVILKPGETFSYNEQTGPRILSNGFKAAPVILGEDYSDAPGGGVCQTSTTIFNAALLSGLQIDQVRNHTKTSHYAPRGRDAMVNDGDSDLKFTNNFDHAIYIEAYGGGGDATAAIYGCSEDRVGVSISIDHFTYNGLPGTKTYRTITKNGKSKKSQIYTAVYRE